MKILFVCTGNTCRSPMAEGILNDKAGKKDLDFSAISAGLFAMQGQGTSEKAIEAMEMIGIDISEHLSRSVSEDLLEEVDLVLALSRGHRDILLSTYPDYEKKIFLLKDYAHEIDDDVDDPYGGSLEDYIRARDEIEKAIGTIVKR